MTAIPVTTMNPMKEEPMLLRIPTSLAIVLSLSILGACSKQEELPAEAAAPAAVEEMVSTPVLMTSAMDVITATVEAIDHETREITLGTEDEESITLTAPDEAHNLDQVQVGDTIVAEIMQSLSVDIVAVEPGTEPTIADVVTGGRAAKGEPAAAAAMESQVIVTIVEAINLENDTFKLKGPDGEVREYIAQNPENLKLAKVGDAVVITLTEAIALSLAQASEEAPPAQE